ncbi:MAG: hypothetical protein OIF50_14625 [Flavobacteriaceae bacterium]|nr:hypothetical protein [Flavobacteriaceae bacterium]
MFWKSKIPAGALQMVLFIGLVIAILLGALVSITYMQIHFQDKQQYRITALQNLESAFFNLDPLEGDSLSTPIIKKTKFWGLYEHLSLSTKIGKSRFFKTALVGGKIEKKDRVALYLADQNRPLVLVGNALLDGTLKLPKRGVKSGSIAGTSYYRDQLTYGTSSLSTAKLPQFGLQKPLDSIFLLESKGFQRWKAREAIYQNSFLNAPLKLYHPGMMQIQNQKVLGHIILKASSKIIVHASAELKDVILIAPEIEFKGNCKHNVQAFATKNIHLRKNTTLEYPSVLAVLGREQNKNIVLEDHSKLNGLLVYQQQKVKETANTLPQAAVFINKNASVFGEVYISGKLEHYGKIYGSVYTNGFLSKQQGGMYLNHLMDGEIRATDFPATFVGSVLPQTRKEVAQWLY